jgi:hypothetical protein
MDHIRYVGVTRVKWLPEIPLDYSGMVRTALKFGFPSA